MRARICLALNLSPGRLPRQTRKLPTTAPADEATDSEDTDAQRAGSVGPR
jgi:hypothetical protein